MLISSTLFVLAALAVAAGPVGQIASAPVLEIQCRIEALGPELGDSIGSALSVISGVDSAHGGDRILIGAFGHRGGIGAVYLAEPLGGEIKLIAAGERTGEALGFSVAVLADVDQDGWRDFAVGAPCLDCDSSGRVLVHSGLTGQALYEVAGTADESHFGASIAVVDDADGDGVQDFVIGAPGDLGAGARSGSVSVISAADGSRLAHVRLGPSELSFGSAVAASGHSIVARSIDALYSFESTDAPGHRPRMIASGPWRDSAFPPYTIDGGTRLVVLPWPEGGVRVAVGNPYAVGADGRRGCVSIVQGNERWHAWSDDRSIELFGTSIAVVCDLDGDGSRDIAVGSPYGGISGSGQVVFISSRSAQELGRYAPVSSSMLGFGSAIAWVDSPAPDVLGHLLVGAPSASVDFEQQGAVARLTLRHVEAPSPNSLQSIDEVMEAFEDTDYPRARMGARSFVSMYWGAALGVERALEQDATAVPPKSPSRVVLDAVAECLYVLARCEEITNSNESNSYSRSLLEHCMRLHHANSYSGSRAAPFKLARARLLAR